MHLFRADLQESASAGDTDGSIARILMALSTDRGVHRTLVSSSVLGAGVFLKKFCRPHHIQGTISGSVPLLNVDMLSDQHLSM